MSATANGFAHAFSTWIAGGNGLNSGKDGVMRYNSGPMRGMTRDAALMKFQNEVWKNAAPEWKDEYAKRATTGMLAPSEQKQAATVPTVTPPMRAPAPEVRPIPADGVMPRNQDGVTYVPQSVYDEKFALKPKMEQESMAAANKPMETPGIDDGEQPASTPTVSPPIRQGGTSQPAFGNRAGTGASATSTMARAKGNGLATSQPAFGSRAGTGASQTGRVAQVKVGI